MSSRFLPVAVQKPRGVPALRMSPGHAEHEHRRGVHTSSLGTRLRVAMVGLLGCAALPLVSWAAAPPAPAAPGAASAAMHGVAPSAPAPSSTLAPLTPAAPATPAAPPAVKVAAAAKPAAARPAVRESSVKAGSFAVRTLAGFGELPVYTWPASGADALNRVGPPENITRAVIVVHGIRRDADKYLAAMRSAMGNTNENVLLIAPRFSSTSDVKRDHLRPDVLAWSKGDWSDGDAADGPAPIASFDVLDAMLTALADRSQFPALRQIVIAGFSAGGQMVQRYAVAGAVFNVVERQGIALRWVVGDPGSLVYFDDRRPTAKGGFAPLRAASCPDFNAWKYGFEKAPPYVAGRDTALMADDYASRDVVYLLGGADTNALHPLLDKSCAGEAQGPHRYARLANYIGYMKTRAPQRLAHRWGIAPGAGHNDSQVFGSACGRAALFDVPGCTLMLGRDAVPPAIP